MSEAQGVFLADAEDGNASKFSSVTQEGSNTFSALAAAALHGAYGFRALFDGANNDAYATYGFASRTEAYLRFYFRLDASFNGNAGTLFPLGLRVTGENRIYFRTVISGGVVSIDRFYHYGDAGALYVNLAQAVSKNVMHYIELHFKASSAAGANDGVAEMWFDGTRIANVSGIDSDTVAINQLCVGAFGTLVPTSGSYIDIDDIKLDSVPIGAYTDQSQAVTLSPTALVMTPASLIIRQAGPSVIIDHSMVEKYSAIPQAYVDQIKTNWLSIPGESHSGGYRAGLILLAAAEPRYAASITEAGTPEAATDTHLRASRATWGDLTHVVGWRYEYGEEDWYTSAAALTQTKAFLQYAQDQGFNLSALGFGWCWDMTWHNAPGGTVDPVYGVRWAGASEGGPEGDLRWGLDAEDTALTGNSISMDTYLAATMEYIDYCVANGLLTKVFFTTGPIDGYDSESGYQRQLKHDRIREYVTATGGYLLDYADIESWSNAGVENTSAWDGHAFQLVAPDNLLQFDGTDGSGITGYHIGERGALRLGKAIWGNARVYGRMGWD